MLPSEFLLTLVGMLAGFIDSMAGGGGLITLPTLSFVLSPGAHAVGTNKIVGTLGALTALIVYGRKVKVPWKKAFEFVAAIMVGSAVGSKITPLINMDVFRWIMISVCPLMLFVTLKKDKWLQTSLTHIETVPQKNHILKLLVAGFACGLYDGAFGPGGGTFMLLALLVIIQLPLMESLVLSKLANVASAGTAWVSYGLDGYVHMKPGFIMATGMIIGAFMGSSLVSRVSHKVVRPALVFVVCLFMAKLLWDALK